MERIKKILYDMRSSLKSEMRTKWMNEDEVKSNNELQSQITEVILIIEREQKQTEQQSNCNLTQVSGQSELLGTVAYEPCVLVARKEQVYTADGKFMFSVSMTERAKQLLDNDEWEKGKESWIDYRKRTEKERELEQQKQYKFADDLAECFNKANGNY